MMTAEMYVYQGAIIMAGKVRWWLSRKKTSSRKEIGKGSKQAIHTCIYIQDKG